MQNPDPDRLPAWLPKERAQKAATTVAAFSAGVLATIILTELTAGAPPILAPLAAFAVITALAAHSALALVRSAAAGRDLTRSGIGNDLATTCFAAAFALVIALPLQAAIYAVPSLIASGLAAMLAQGIHTRRKYL